MPTAKSINRSLKRALEDLGRARDEVRVDLHLLGMDARALWSELEAKAEALEEDIADRGQRAAEASIGVIDDLVRSLRDLVERSRPRPSGILITAGSLMTDTPEMCAPTNRLSDAARILWEADCGGVPVVDTEGVVVGMLTDRDVCMAAYTQGLRLDEIVVGQVMSRSVVSCRRGDPVEKLLEQLATNRIRRLPVVDEQGRLLGLVSIADLALHAAEVESDALLVATARTLAVLSTPRSGT